MDSDCGLRLWLATAFQSVALTCSELSNRLQAGANRSRVPVAVIPNTPSYSPGLFTSILPGLALNARLRLMLIQELLHPILVHVEVGVDVLHVVMVLERVQQAQQKLG